MLLVEPTTDASGKASYKPIVFHAGGAAWYGNYLYVPHTTKGLRVFDLRRFIKVQTGDGNAVGWSTKHGGYHGMNYRYVLPQVGFYSLCATCCVRLSFLGLDRTTTPARLISGEYAVGDARGRLHMWPLDAATGRLQTAGALVQSVGAYFPGVRRMQGGLTIGAEVWVSSSDKYPGTTSIAALYHYAAPGKALLTRKLPRVPEDLTYRKATDGLWTLTEEPGKRYVWSMPRGSLGGKGCEECWADQLGPARVHWVASRRLRSTCHCRPTQQTALGVMVEHIAGC